MDGTMTAAQSAALLTAIAAREECVEELVGAARAMRERSLHVEHGLPLLMDVCGTGGDAAGTINISTMVALVVAAAGVPVAKHGNRAASSTCGSADVLEAVGTRIDLTPAQAAEMLESCGFAFMFAPAYHPAMKNVAPLRRELGVRTIFNVLGPLTNPARATHQVVGVARERHLELVGDALRALGVQAGAVVHSDGVDEIVGDRAAIVYEFNEEAARRWIFDPGDYGVRVPLAELKGGSKESCSRAFLSILDGEQSGRAKVVWLNAGFALHVAGKANDISAGMEQARTAIADGRVSRLLQATKTGSQSP